MPNKIRVGSLVKLNDQFLPNLRTIQGPEFSDVYRYKIAAKFTYGFSDYVVLTHMGRLVGILPLEWIS